MTAAVASTTDGQTNHISQKKTDARNDRPPDAGAPPSG